MVWGGGGGLLDSETLARAFGKRNEVVLEVLSVALQPAFRLEGLAVGEDLFAGVHDRRRHHDHGLAGGVSVSFEESALGGDNSIPRLE